MSRRRSRVAKCYTELAAAPATLMHDGQVIRLATHVWRECAYHHITDKSQERDLSGVLCTAWLVHSRPTTSATTSSATSAAAPPPPPNLRIRRLWLVNQHNCSVHTSRAVPLGPKAGVVHAWGPRETEPEPGDRSRGHQSNPNAAGGAGSGAAVPAVSQPCYAGPQYRTLRQGPCWELCTVCDVTAQLEDSVTGEDLGLLKSEDKVVSAEVVFNWRDLAGVLLHLLVLMLHLITIHPIQALAAAATRRAQIAQFATARVAVWVTAGCQEAAGKVSGLLAARWAAGGSIKSALGWVGQRQRVKWESEEFGAAAVEASAGGLLMGGCTVQGAESSEIRASSEGEGSSTGTSCSKHGVSDLCGDGGEGSAGDTGSVDGVDKHSPSLPAAASGRLAEQSRGSLGQQEDRQQAGGQAYRTDAGGGGVRDGNSNSDCNSRGKRLAAPCSACGTSDACSIVSSLHSSSSSSDDISGGEESVSDSKSGSGSSMQLPTGAACSGRPVCSNDAALSDGSSTDRSLSVRGRGIANCTHSSGCSSCATPSSSVQPAGDSILRSNCSPCASSSPPPSLQSAEREAVLATREGASSALSSPSLPLSTAQTHRPVTLPTSSAPPHPPHLTVLSSAQPSAPGAHHSLASTPPYTLASVAPHPSVQLPAWSGHVFAGRGTMQSAVFCTAVLMGLAAAVLATGVATVLVDLLQSVRSLA